MSDDEERVMREHTYLDPANQERCVECGAGVDLCLCVDVKRAIQERLFSREGQFLRGVLSEIDKGEFDKVDHLFNELAFSVGLLGKTLAEQGHEDHTTAKAIMGATLQIAALVTIIGTEGDENYEYDPDILFVNKE